MSGHRHMNDPSLTQNQGNVLGDRPCVRQSRIYREQCGGNAMKELMGQSELKWNTSQTEGCYAGHSVYDHNTVDHRAHPSALEPSSPPAAAAAGAGAEKPNGNTNNNNNSTTEAPSPSFAHNISNGRGFRPGAGQANRQTFNIFTGQ